MSSTADSPVRKRLLQTLADGRFHSGEALGAELGVSRAAVWKAMDALRRAGVEVHAVSGRGYRLARRCELLESALIRDAMGVAATQCLSELEVLAEVDSTNRHLLQRVPELRSGHVAIAEVQSAGRGRRGRGWIAGWGTSLLLSVYWNFPYGPAALGGLSLAVGAVLARALVGLGADEVRLKWPNDLTWRGRKLGGILLELSGESSGPSHTVVGVGINWSLGALADSVDQITCDLEGLLPNASRNAVAGHLIGELLVAMEMYGRVGPAPFLDVWRDYDDLKGKPVRVLLPDGAVAGTAAGIADDGRLRIDTGSGPRLFSYGEVSVRTDVAAA